MESPARLGDQQWASDVHWNITIMLKSHQLESVAVRGKHREAHKALS